MTLDELTLWFWSLGVFFWGVFFWGVAKSSDADGVETLVCIAVAFYVGVYHVMFGIEIVTATLSLFLPS